MAPSEADREPPSVTDAPVPSPTPFHGRLLATLFTAAALLTLVMMVIRLITCRDELILVTGGAGGVSVYPLWKLIHDFPLYEAPTEGTFTFTLYNFFFYHLYGLILGALGADDGRIIVYGRWITLAFAVAGAVFQAGLVRTLLPGALSRSQAVALGSLVTVAWLGWDTVWWYSTTVRPDVPSMTLVTAALLLSVRSLQRECTRTMIVAALVFYLAWSFKQTSVWTLTAVTLYCLGTKRWRLAAVLCVICIGLFVATLVVGGHDYRANVLHGPTVNRWFPKIMLRNIAMVGFKSWFFVLFALWPLAWLRRLYVAPGTAHESTAPIGVIKLALVVSFLTCAVTGGKSGSSLNHFFEPLFHAITLAVVILLSFVARPREGRPLLAKLAPPLWALVVLGLLVHLLVPAGVSSTEFLFADSVRSHRQAAARRHVLVEHIQQVPKPLFFDEEVLGQPWHATDGKHPATVIDHVFYKGAKRKGLLAGGGVGKLIEDGHYRAVITKQEKGRAKPSTDAYEAVTEQGIEPSTFPPGSDGEKAPAGVRRRARRLHGLNLYVMPEP